MGRLRFIRTFIVSGALADGRQRGSRPPPRVLHGGMGFLQHPVCFFAAVGSAGDPVDRATARPADERRPRAPPSARARPSIPGEFREPGKIRRSPHGSWSTKKLVSCEGTNAWLTTDTGGNPGGISALSTI